MAGSKISNIVAVIMFLLSFSSCHYEPIDYSKMVVEGWIDAGKHPIVMLHTSYSLNQPTDDTTQLMDVLAEHMILFGKVTIFDGEDSVILTGRVDTNYLPPYIYTTTKIIGEVGKTYSLRASYTTPYTTLIAKSQTEIPAVATFDSIRVTEYDKQLNVVGYANNLETGAPYILMARTTNQRQYKICPTGAFRATAPNMAITINNPLDFTVEGMILQTLFPKTDTVGVSIKFAKVGEAEFQMWDSYIAQNMTQGMFFMETHGNILSNIEGGNGYWCGMGASEYTISLKKGGLYTFK
jgi:hypothetical protein